MGTEGPAQRDPAAEVARLIPVTDRPSWLMLVGLALLVAASLVWVFLGTMPDEVGGAGLIIPQGGFVEVGVDVVGSIIDVQVNPGDEVAAGSVVARIRDEDGNIVSVTAPVDGKVATVLVRAGGVTDRGATLMELIPKDSTLVAVAFVPAGPGKRVQQGMPVRVSLESFPRSQFGMLEGIVLAVSPVPVSPERVTLMVGDNQTLADYFTAQGPILEVTVSLSIDAATASGYRWTTGKGPQASISPGTLADVAVVVSSDTVIRSIVK